LFVFQKWSITGVSGTVSDGIRQVYRNINKIYGKAYGDALTVLCCIVYSMGEDVGGYLKMNLLEYYIVLGNQKENVMSCRL
jgi:hypothetical protein